MAADIKAVAAELRRQYARERYAIRRQKEIDAAVEAVRKGEPVKKDSPEVDELTLAHRAYMRRYYANNPEARKAKNAWTEKYWERKAAAVIAARREE
jgi:hypothetical protein